MTIAELSSAGKALLERVPRDLWVVLVLVLSATASFGLGIEAGRDMGQGSGFGVSQIPLGAAALDAVGGATPPAEIPAGGEVVASKTGTKYYLPWCSGAKQITDANRIWFATKEEAESKGYQAATNCKGL